MRANRSGNRPGPAIVLWAIFVPLLSSTVPTPLYPVYAAQHDLTATFQALIFFAHSVGVILALLSVGRYGDRLKDRRIPIIGGLLLVGAGAVVMVLQQSLAWLLVGRAIIGFGAGSLTGAANAALIELLGKSSEHRAAVLGSSVFTFGAALGPVVTAIFIEAGFFPSQVPFALVGAAALICAVRLSFSAPLPVFRALAAMPAERTERSSSPSLFIVLLLSGGAVSASWAVIGTFMALGAEFARTVFSFSSAGVVALALSCIQLIAGGSQLAGRLMPARLAYTGGLCIQLTGIGLCATSVYAQTSWMLWPGIVATSGGYGLTFVGAASLVNQYAPPARLAGAISVFYVAAYVGNIGSVLVGEVAQQWGSASAIYAEAAAAMLIFPILIIGMLLIPNQLHRSCVP